MVKDLDTKNTLIRGTCDGDLYTLLQNPMALTASTTTLWHQRLGHASPNVLRMIATSSNLVFPVPRNYFVCDSCELGKWTRFPFPVLNKRAMYPLHIIYSDVWGPSPDSSVSSYKFYVIFIDSFSRYTWLYPMHSKSDVFKYFLQFLSSV